MSTESQRYEITFPAVFARNVAAHPDRPAVVTTTRSVTYAELNEQADRIAAPLLARASRDAVAICLLFGQEIAAFAASIAVLKSGHFYVMLDPLYPPARLVEILIDTGAGVLVTNNACLDLAHQLCPAGVEIVNIDTLPAAGAPLSFPAIAPDAYAYIGYTSGSTGKAKGVIETHRNHSCHWQNLMRLQPDYGRARVLFLNRLSFSGGQLAFYLTLLAGATLYLYDLPNEGMPGLPGWIQQHQITVWNSVPTVFRAFVAHVAAPEQVASIRLLRLASDAVLPQDIEAYHRLFGQNCQLWFCYALTEAKTVTMTFLSHAAASALAEIPSGPPIDGMEVWIVDEAGQRLGPNQVGEIIVRSRYVSPGYWRDSTLTAVRFRPDPDAKGLFLVQTGDLGKLDDSGNLVHKGRKDSQVKVRGYRVELSEIELHLARLAGVQAAAVRAFPLVGGDVRLAAYLVCQSSPPPSSSQLRHLLSQRLPDYMLPATFTLIERMPVNRNGKIDRAALPPPGAARPALDTPFVPPRTELERAVAAIWAELLALDAVGIDDNFFELGGDSLLAMRVVIAVEAGLGRAVPRNFFRQPTIACLVTLLVADAPNVSSTNEHAENLAFLSHSPVPKPEIAGPLRLIRKVTRQLRRVKSKLRSVPHQIRPRLRGLFEAWAFRRPYFEGIAWLMKWCKQTIVQQWLYPDESRSIRRFAQSMGTTAAIIDQEVQLNLVSRILHKHHQEQRRRRRAQPNRPYTVFYEELQQALTLGAMTPGWHRYFQTVGEEALVAALHDGQGVILVGPHPVTAFVQSSFTTQFSPMLDLNEGKYKETFAALFADTGIPYSKGRQIARAAVAVEAHQILTRGGLVVIAGDEEDATVGFPVTVGNRVRHLVPGFAELAVATNACLLPIYTELLGDGQIQIVLGPALCWDRRCRRSDQVAQIMHSYGALLTDLWREKPSIAGSTNLDHQLKNVSLH
ncbi:MAG: AMP-binding protein [Chloroflexi bacterium]|nr:AMP-binding protein [Chloroflexota bacterium]